jgi:broad specificity phosphatase PhoE
VKELTGGWTNTALTELGRKQAVLTGHRLHAIIMGRSVAFYSSDLDRAFETAQIIGSILDKKPLPEKALRELNWGIAVDMSLVEADRLELDKTEPLFDWVPFPDAESRRMLYQRISRILTEIDANEDDTVLIVGHGNAIEECIFWWLDLLMRAQLKIAFDIDPCSITHLRVNKWGERTIALLNSSDHLLSLASDI